MDIWIEHKALNAEPRRSTTAEFEKLLASKGWTLCEPPVRTVADVETFDPGVQRREELGKVKSSGSDDSVGELRRKQLSEVQIVTTTDVVGELRREQLAEAQSTNQASPPFDPAAIRRAGIIAARIAANKTDSKAKNPPSKKRAKKASARKSKSQ